MTDLELTHHLEVSLRHGNYEEAKKWIEKGANLNRCYTFERDEIVGVDDDIEEIYKEINIFDFAVKVRDYKLLTFILNNGYCVNVFILSAVMRTNDIKIIQPVFNKYKLQRGDQEPFKIFNFINENSIIRLYIKSTLDIKMEVIDFFLECGEDINQVTTIDGKSTTILDDVIYSDIKKELRKRGAKTYKQLQEEKGKTEWEL